jgi:hypothetical protein
MLREGDLKNTVLKRISLDEYEPKTGEDKDVMVLGFLLNDKKPGKDLYHFLNNSIVEIRDVEVSPNPNPDNFYMVFCEIDRNETSLDNVKSIVQEVERLSGKLKWEVSTVFNEENIGLDDDSLLSFIQLDPENYLDKDSFIAKQEEAKKEAEEQRLEEEAQDRTQRIFEFLKPTNILEAGVNDEGVLHIRGSRDIASLKVINFGHGPDVMSELGISESAIDLDYDKVKFGKLNAMLGELKALPINEYVVIYNPEHKDILVTKAV